MEAESFDENANLQTSNATALYQNSASTAFSLLDSVCHTSNDTSKSASKIQAERTSTSPTASDSVSKSDSTSSQNTVIDASGKHTSATPSNASPRGSNNSDLTILRKQEAAPNQASRKDTTCVTSCSDTRAKVTSFETADCADCRPGKLMVAEHVQTADGPQDAPCNNDKTLPFANEPPANSAFANETAHSGCYAVYASTQQPACTSARAPPDLIVSVQQPACAAYQPPLNVGPSKRYKSANGSLATHAPRESQDSQNNANVNASVPPRFQTSRQHRKALNSAYPQTMPLNTVHQAQTQAQTVYSSAAYPNASYPPAAEAGYYLPPQPAPYYLNGSSQPATAPIDVHAFQASLQEQVSANLAAAQCQFASQHPLPSYPPPFMSHGPGYVNADPNAVMNLMNAPGVGVGVGVGLAMPLRNVPPSQSVATQLNGVPNDYFAIPTSGVVATQQRAVVLQELLNSIQPAIVREVEARSVLVCLSAPNEHRIQVRLDQRDRAAGSGPSPRRPANANAPADDAASGRPPGRGEQARAQTNIVFEYEFELDRLRFELRLGEGSSSKMKTVFCGEATEIKLEDLKAGTEYYTDARALLENAAGRFTEAVRFVTAPDRPEAPDGVKLLQRGRSYVLLKWDPPRANGSKIISYTVEFAEGKQRDLDALADAASCADAAKKVEHSRHTSDAEPDAGNGTEGESSAPGSTVQRLISTGSQQRIGRLQAASNYTVRIAARNALGLGAFCAPQTVTTCGDAPERLDAPRLLEASASWLKLSWTRKNEADEVAEFRLEVEDQATGHGFIPAYCGADSCYTVHSLRRNAEYRFRVAAANEVGTSCWSDPVAYRTLPEAPRAPTALELRARPTHSTATLKWTPPTDSGGLELGAYLVELRLKPSPPPPPSPQPTTRPRAVVNTTAATTTTNSVNTTESASAGDSPPATDGGEWAVVYEGSKCEFQCTQLRPNSTYQIRVRAVTLSDAANASGARFVSEPSALLELTTLADLPGPCSGMRLLGKCKPTALELRWARPIYDGYGTATSLGCACPPPGIAIAVAVAGMPTPESPGWPSQHQHWTAPKWTAPPLQNWGAQSNWPAQQSWPPSRSWQLANEPDLSYEVEMDCEADGRQRRVVHRGAQEECVVAGLTPGVTYAFNVRARNAVGFGPWMSDWFRVDTAPSRPLCAPRELRCELYSSRSDAPEPGVSASASASAARTCICVTWRALGELDTGGLPIVDYLLECRQRKLAALATEPAASSSVASGGVSDTTGSARFEFEPVYRGARTDFVLEEVQAFSAYELRVACTNRLGVSPFSDAVECRTAAGRPSAPRRDALSAHAVDESRIALRWQVPCADELNGGVLTGYRVELRSSASTAWMAIECSRSATEYELDELLPNCAYQLRLLTENEFGLSEPSSPLVCRTLCEPPRRAAGRVELVSASSSVLRIKWPPYDAQLERDDVDDHVSCSSADEATTSSGGYQPDEAVSPSELDAAYVHVVEMRQLGDAHSATATAHFQTVYRGADTQTRVQRLTEATEYEFRLRVENSRGASPFGEPSTFRTGVQQPGAVRSCVVRELAAQGCVLEWFAARLRAGAGATSNAEQQVVFEVQLAAASGHRVLRTVYRGGETRLVCVGLLPACAYLFRVRAVRLRAAAVAAVAGPFSPLGQFVTASAHASLVSGVALHKLVAAQLLARCGATARTAAGYALVSVSLERRVVRARAQAVVPASGDVDESDCDEQLLVCSADGSFDSGGSDCDVWPELADSAGDAHALRLIEADVLVAEPLSLADLPLDQGQPDSAVTRRVAKTTREAFAAGVATTPKERAKERDRQGVSYAASAVRNRVSSGQRGSPSKKKASLLRRTLKRFRLLIGLELDDAGALDETALRPETRFMIFVTVLLLAFAIAFACVCAWYSSVLN